MRSSVQYAKDFLSHKNKDVKNWLSNFFFLLLGAITVNSEMFARILFSQNFADKTLTKWQDRSVVGKSCPIGDL